MSITVRPLRRPMANASAAVPCSQRGARERTGATFEMVELGCCEWFHVKIRTVRIRTVIIRTVKTRTVIIRTVKTRTVIIRTVKIIIRTV
jgi:hypothetical protein